MNINPSGLEKYYSHQIIIWNNDSGINPGPVRSTYRCTFCKRGFSNAQALGGHMNIHRKDRAKLVEISEENMLSLDVSDSRDDFQAVGEKSGLETSDETREKAGSEDKPGESQETERNPSMIVSPGFRENSTTMMLFSESPSGKLCVGEDLEKSDGAKIKFQGEVIDLELRLGPGKT